MGVIPLEEMRDTYYPLSILLCLLGVIFGLFGHFFESMDLFFTYFRDLYRCDAPREGLREGVQGDIFPRTGKTLFSMKKALKDTLFWNKISNNIKHI